MGDGTVAREARRLLDAAGLRASVLVHDLGTGAEIAIEPDVPYPLASVVKLPLAVAVLERAAAGTIDLRTVVRLGDDERTPGPTGLSQFTHPVSVALEDLLYLATCVSDDTAADALFARCPPREVNVTLRSLGISDITVRHPIHELHRTLASRLGPDEMHLALSLAIRSATEGRGHLVPQLDVTQANVGTARGLVRLLREVWSGRRLAHSTVEATRSLLARNVLRNRLAPDLESDTSRWSSKTGTFLHLRHEVGVLEHQDGSAFAISVLSESSVPARIQPAAEQALGLAARLLHDELRSRRRGSSWEADRRSLGG